MTTRDPRLVMAFLFVVNRVVSNRHLAHLAMMPGAFAGFHMLFPMGGGVAGDIGSADVADGYLN